MSQHEHDAARRVELGAFLRSRRARLQPGAVHLPSAGRRRTPGLRREEVARLAGISVAWYTWLEQGRDIRVSEEVLQRVMEALRLTADERRHVTLLSARGVAPPRLGVQEVPPKFMRLLEAMPHLPAAVMGRYAEVLAISPALRALLPPATAKDARGCNFLVLVFTDAGLKARLSDWQSVARECLAHFRVGYADLVGDARAERIVARLRRESAEFAEWWERHELEPAPTASVVLDHPEAGSLSVDHVLLFIGDAPGLTLGIISPADGETRGRIRRLADAAARAPR